MASTPKTISQPVVAIVGHIDHGKTTLLDYIRKSRVAEKETGGITQGISAYEIEHETKEGGARAITFIDTPGHEAFQKMRRRGASAADIAILIVAADDGVKPQTKEAWSAITDAGIPFIVAFTKVDKDTANVERAKESVLTEGIYLEGLGGSVPWVAVSGTTGDGVPELLDLIVLVSDLEEITCDPVAEPRAVVIESSRDPKTGVSATTIVKSGTFRAGNFAVAGDAWAPLRAFEDSARKMVKEAPCGTPVRMSGFSTEPKVGTEITMVKSKKEAEALAKENAVAPKERDATTPEEEKESIRLILKADTLGSVEALQYELEKVPQENAKCIVVETGTGAISENDVKTLVGFENAIILGFRVSAEAAARDLAERQNIRVETRDIIYELTEWLTKEIATIAPGTPEEEVLGSAKILKHFSTAGTKHIVGGRVESGVIKRGALVTISRRDTRVGRGKITNMQSQKADVDSVSEGTEFGAQIDTKADVVSGDTIEIITGGHE